jgi:hypothetical protein
MKRTTLETVSSLCRLHRAPAVLSMTRIRLLDRLSFRAFCSGSALQEMTQAIQCISIRRMAPFFGLCMEQIRSIMTVKIRCADTRGRGSAACGKSITTKKPTRSLGLIVVPVLLRGRSA